MNKPTENIGKVVKFNMWHSVWRSVIDSTSPNVRNSVWYDIDCEIYYPTVIKGALCVK